MLKECKSFSPLESVFFSNQHGGDHGEVDERVGGVVDDNGHKPEAGLADEGEVDDEADDEGDEGEEPEEKAYGGGAPVQRLALLLLEAALALERLLLLAEIADHDVF